MCGIVGILERNSYQSSNSMCDIEIMLNTIKHRGPDQNRIDTYKNGIYFGFARLAMLDIAKSQQPISNYAQNLFLYFNGEIYNYKKLKIKLKQLGYKFRTNGDGEVILALYEMMGKNFVDYLDGMFAICIVDVKKNEVIMSRDKYGIKPLYYYNSGERILIASELKAIKKILKNSYEIDTIGLELYFRMRFIPAPYTPFKNIYKLKAGETIVFKQGDIYKRYNCKYNNICNYEFIDDFENILTNNIIETYNSDYPLGIFLSGGIDSGVIASCLVKNNKKLTTFTVGYEGNNSCDEILEVKEITNELKIPSVFEVIKSNEVLKLINAATYFLDEPFYSSVAISSLKLSQIASSFVKGVLSGDGSDEIIFGYQYLRDALKLSNINDIINKYISSIGWLKNTGTQKVFLGSKLNNNEFLDILFDGCKMSNISETLRRVEMFKRLPDYHFCRIDRTSMAYGIEARVPYVRNEIVNYMLGIDSSIFLKERDPKYILKKSLKNLLPKNYVNKYKKPFTSPIKQWIESNLNCDINRLFNNRLLVDKANLNRKYIIDLWENYKGEYWETCNIWGIYMLLKWFSIIDLDFDEYEGLK